MAEFMSVQETNRTASPPTYGPASDHAGKSRKMCFDYTSPSSSPPQIGDTINLGTIPKGARITGGSCAFGAFGASCTIGIGSKQQLDDASNALPTRYKAQTSIAAAGQFPIAQLLSENVGDILTEDKIIYATVAGAAMAASTQITGEIAYIPYGD